MEERRRRRQIVPIVSMCGGGLLSAIIISAVFLNMGFNPWLEYVLGGIYILGLFGCWVYVRRGWRLDHYG